MKQIRLIKSALYFFWISLHIVAFVVSSCENNNSIGTDKKIVLPCSVPDDCAYCYVYILREQDCSPCRVSSLYQWEDIIHLIGRDDIYYLFIVEPNPEDTEEELQKALKKRPFHRTVYIDYQQTFLNHNRWLKEDTQIDGFVIEMDKSKVIAIGNPMTSFEFMLSMHSLEK